MRPNTGYKKDDNSKIHRSCLETLITNRGQHDDIPTCTTCRRPYRIRIDWRFVLEWRRLLSCASLMHVVEFLTVVCAVFCTFFSVYVLIQSGELEKEHFMVRAMVCFMALGTGILVILTLRKVFGRWKTENSSAAISMV